MADAAQLQTETLAALRGASWNGTRCRTLRVAGSGMGSAVSAAGNPLTIDESATPAEIGEAYRAHLAATGQHPGAIVVGGVTVLAGEAADSLGEAAAVNPAGPGDELDAVVAAATSRGTVMRDRVVLVTGGAQGFGYEIARGLAAAGAQLVLADLNLDGARAAADRLAERFGRAVHRAVAVNVADEDSVRAMFDEIAASYGGVDLVVSNAGVLKAGSVKELELRDFRFVTDVNYQGFFLVTKWASRLLAAQNAAAAAARPAEPLYTDIIEINSKSGLAGSNKNGAYAGSKFGGIGLVQSFAMELVTDNIKVNAICPGNFFDGPLWSDPDRGLFVQYLRAGKVPGARTVEDVRRSYEARVPMGRGCAGADVVRAIMSVVEQVYETGQAVPVTGGQEMLR